MPAQTDPVLRLHTLCPYYTMFPLRFPFTALSQANAGDWVLDPFCGRGTTLFASRLRGLPSVGIDSNPVAAAIAAAKLAIATAEDIIALCRRILEEGDSHQDVPEAEFWQRCYSRKTLLAICILREYFAHRCVTPEEIILRALVLGILHGPQTRNTPTYLSNQMPRTYATKPAAALRFWKRHRMFPSTVDVSAAVRRRAHFSLAEIPKASGGRVYLADSRTANIGLRHPPFTWVITSPPYFGMRTYRPDQWIRNWFLGGRVDVDYGQDGQIPHQDESFTAEMAKVWANVARFCQNGARLVIRFGSLPSKETDARAIIRESLSLADRGWRILTVRDAGKASNGNRQAEQFRGKTNEALREIDVYARLET
ncbi:hypothetical protein HZA56_05540 [Candidatus Poribacteria bacterium]|nr:hypothetical protein [Candidatus Poribacteria bacterium]